MGRSRLKQQVLLKCAQDFVFIRCGKMTFSETTALKADLPLIVPRGRGLPHPTGPMGSPRDSLEAEDTWSGLSLWLSW